MRRLLSSECRKRVKRTFLQTACGVLGAGLVAAVTDFVQQVPGWKTGLLTLLASSIAAGIAAVMNPDAMCPEPNQPVQQAQPEEPEPPEELALSESAKTQMQQIQPRE